MIRPEVTVHLIQELINSVFLIDSVRASFNMYIILAFLCSDQNRFCCNIIVVD